MKLRNEFEVGVPLERTWNTLVDVARVARALPGATIEPDAEGGAWRGGMKVKLGPVTTEYMGTARVQDADEDGRVVSFRVEGREVRGQGSAAATITARLGHADGGTRVAVETDMQVTGRQAQLGRSLMEDVAGAILGEFAGRLEKELTGEGLSEAEASGDDALDVSSAVRGAMAERIGIFTFGALLGLIIGVRIRSRRS